MVTPEHPGPLWLRHVPLAIVVALIALGAVVSIPEPQLLAGQDKLNHALAFLAFAVTLRFAQPSWHRGWVMLLAVIVGSAVEIVQAFMAGMDATFWDVLADAAGGGIGCLLPSRAWARIERWLSRWR